MAILITIMIPQMIIRFADVPATDSVSFDPEVVLSKSDPSAGSARATRTRRRRV
jgi:hypothetical protein